jgi:TetR/AcrR family transcriptional regulator, lmrAB and yxaGH operons repressor
MAPDTRERMVRATGRLMRDQGFHATGLNEIVATAEAPKGSLYFHFPGGKVALAAAAVDSFAAAISRYMREGLDEGTCTADAVESFLEATAARLERTEFRSGCVVATVALEAGAQEPLLGDACDRGLRDWIEILAEGLERDGFDPVDARHRAELVVATLEGAIVLAKARRDATPVRSLASTLRELVLERT